MKKILLIVVFLLLGAVTFGRETNNMQRVQKNLAKKIIRLHIRANSDSDEDQKLKLIVRDAVCDYLSDKLADSKDITETRRIITENMDYINELAVETIHKNGYDYNVNVYLENTYFPLKTYGDLTFPPGIYEAFCIDIGGGNGHNWWCVMYPPLCFIEATYAVAPEEFKEQLKAVLNDEEYNAVTLRDCPKDEICFKFKIVEFFESL